MKKCKHLLIAISSLLLVSCGVDNSSVTSSSNTTQVSSTAENSSKTSPSSISSVDDNSVEASELKEKLKSAIDTANKKDALKIESTDFTMDMTSAFSKKITYYNSDGALDTTQGDNGVTIQSGNLDAKVNNATMDIGAKNLQGETKNDLLTSIKLLFDLDVTYQGFGATKAKEYQGEQLDVAAYLEQGSIYVDFDDDTVRSAVLDSVNDFYGLELNAAVLPKYFKLDNVLSKTTPWPLSVIDSQMIDDDLSVIFDEYDSLPGAAKSAITFSKDETDYHINININKVVLATMPILYQSIATGKLDPESENYNEELQNIKDTVTQMNRLISKTSINTIKCDFAFNEAGYSYIDYEIDFVIKDYELDSKTTTNDDGTSDEESITIDELTLKTSGHLEFLYDDAVTVLKHPNNTYITIDMEALLASLKDE
jgi:hypothetical protein